MADVSRHNSGTPDLPHQTPPHFQFPKEWGPFLAFIAFLTVFSIYSIQMARGDAITVAGIIAADVIAVIAALIAKSKRFR